MTRNRARKTRNIVRIIDGGQKGWQVRISRRGRRFHPYFSDSKYGGARKALAAALAMRNEIELLNPPFTRQDWADRPMRSNKSGVPGVQIHHQEYGPGRNRRTRAFVLATWSPRPGVVKKRYFSVQKYGRARALKLAVAARRAGVLAMEP